MPEIVLNPTEKLLDRLLGERAMRVRQQIIDLQRSHEQDVIGLLDGVAARAGISGAIPVSARRDLRPDGSVVLSWEEEQPAPPVSAPAQ